MTKITFNGFSSHSVMTYAAAIAFYTIFSLPGLLITIIVFAGFFLGQDAVQGELVAQLQGFIGTASAETVENIITRIELSGDFTLGTIIGVSTLLFSATTIFISLQEALNRVWDVVATPKKGFIKFLINRVLSFGMIISLGFILLVSLLLDSVLALFFDKLENSLGKKPSMLLELTSSFTSLIAVFAVILLVFKVLPDVKLRWKNVLISALITTLFLMLGNLFISWYISNSDFSATYEAAGSIIIILVWVYYSTVVVLFGAEITRAVMIHNGHPIRPAKGAKKVKTVQLDYEKYQSDL
ncbi:YihY/virulence factor BrkB family protein [Putridiphycobacter roseus]|uniref:YihY/virulence factor BrkB family protein n=1 Tax=Putridiphycobacter roseus TaxID=2219161 RepID=UPI001314C9E8|nr:YihY/virulence factor BrkB family protein [Putridiphycobacter roseus]